MEDPYDRGTRLKPGQTNFGSGTTPTLFGRAAGRRFVAITDNADPRMHVLVFRRGRDVTGRRLVCKQALIAKRRSATENSLVYVAHSFIVENNYGYSGPTATEDGGVTSRGISRVVLERRGGCHVAWTSHERVPSAVSKACRRTGLLYTYTKDPNRKHEDGGYLTAVSVRTRRTVFTAPRTSGRWAGWSSSATVDADAVSLETLRSLR